MNMFLSLLNAAVQNAPSKTPEIKFEPMNFVLMLEYMAKGMLVIFILIGVIIVTTMIVNKLFSAKK